MSARVWTPLRRKSGIVTGQAWCQVCGWETEQYKNALANAARHARATGHEVRVEQGICVIYNPPPEPSK